MLFRASVLFLCIGFQCDAMRHDHSDVRCEFRQKSEYFCENSADAMAWLVVKDKLTGEKPVGVARLKFKDSTVSDGKCYLQYAFGAASEAEAQQKAMECCEKTRQQQEEQGNYPMKECKLVGPSVSDDYEKKCNFRLGKKKWFKDECSCPEDRPHMLKPESKITWHTPGAAEFDINIEDQVVCIDDCTARSLGSPPVKTDLSREDWPVVFLAVYKIGIGIVHSNLAFCPNASIVKDKEACFQPGGKALPRHVCDSSRHTSAFATGNDVPRLLMEHGCRELIFDGNEGGDIWKPGEHETGCWAQGLGAQSFWWSNGGDGGRYRSRIGYQKLFWMSSDNSVHPFAETSQNPGWHAKVDETSLEMRMKTCFNAELGTRLDFNPGTYSLLHHNCNKFSGEAMRQLNLPLFAKEADKGRHSAIALSATPEESKMRRGLHKAISYFAPERSSVSTTCRKEIFDADLNCRRIGWGGRKGDCPVDGKLLHEVEPLRCYDPNMRSSQGTGGLSKPVEYNDPVNGVCGIPAGTPCDLSQRFNLAPCQPGFHCAKTIVKEKYKLDNEEERNCATFCGVGRPCTPACQQWGCSNCPNPTSKQDVYEYRDVTQELCVMDDDCGGAVSGATMRESDNHETGAWCKCPQGSKAKCGPTVLDRYFNPLSALETEGTCSCVEME